MKPDEHDIQKILDLKKELAGKNIVGLTIARGGSRRLPRKNVLPFCGRPLVAWSLLQMKYSLLITHPYLSTDDDEIASIGEEYGIPVIRRPDFGHDATAAVAYAHSLKNIDHAVDLFVPMLPTSPLRHVYDIDESIKLYYDFAREEKNIEIIIVVPEMERTVYERLDKNKYRALFSSKDWKYAACQGSWQVLTKEQFYEDQSRLPSTKDSVLDKIPSVESNPEIGYFHSYECEIYQQFDIDLLEHFELLELMMKYHILKNDDNPYEKYWINAMEILKIGEK